MKNSQVREAIIKERVEKEVAVMKYLDPQKAILEQEESPQRRDSRTQWPQHAGMNERYLSFIIVLFGLLTHEHPFLLTFR